VEKEPNYVLPVDSAKRIIAAMFVLGDQGTESIEHKPSWEAYGFSAI